MFSRLGMNRSPQHQTQPEPQQHLHQSPLAFNKKKVLLPASVFNKVQKQRSVSRQPTKPDKSLTPTPHKHKLQAALQPSKSRTLLHQHKSKDQSRQLSRSNLKPTHLCQNCNSFMGNNTRQSLSPIKYHSIKEQMKSVKDIKKRNDINSLYELIGEKSKQIDEKKDQYQIEEMRIIENFKREKEKINEFYNKINSIISKHRQTTLIVIDKKQQQIIGQLRQKMNAISLKIQSLSTLSHHVSSLVPKLQKLSQQLFSSTLSTIKTQYSKLIFNFITPTIFHKPLTVKTGDEKYLSKQVIEVVEHFLSIQNLPGKKGQFRNRINEVDMSLGEMRGRCKSQVSLDGNTLEKYISVVERERKQQQEGNEQEECEMLLSKRL